MRLFCQLVRKIIPSEETADQFTLQQTNRDIEIILAAHNSLSVYWRTALLNSFKIVKRQKEKKEKKEYQFKGKFCGLFPWNKY